jgi:hypothetical protein
MDLDYGKLKCYGFGLCEYNINVEPCLKFDIFKPLESRIFKWISLLNVLLFVCDVDLGKGSRDSRPI